MIINEKLMNRIKDSLSKFIRKTFDKDFKEIFLSQIVSISGGLFAGTLLAYYTDKILLIPGMFILLPGFLEMRGNISGSLASRISSGLFLKIINPDKTNTPIIRGNILASLFLAVIVSFSLGSITCLINYFVFKKFTPEIILVALIAGILANFIEIPLSIITTLKLFKKGHDPNNIMGPFVTSTGDIVSIISILIALLIV